jgi:hypothetical protein
MFQQAGAPQAALDGFEAAQPALGRRQKAAAQVTRQVS